MLSTSYYSIRKQGSSGKQNSFGRSAHPQFRYALDPPNRLVLFITYEVSVIFAVVLREKSSAFLSPTQP